MAPNPFVEEQLAALHRGALRPAAWRAFAVAFWRRSRENARDRTGLVRELRLYRRAGMVVALLAGLAISAEGVPPLPALAWPLVAWLVLTAWVWAELGLVRHPLTGGPSPAIGPANLMTLYRGWSAAPVLLVGLYCPGPTAAWVGFCLLAGFTDLLDGTVALRLGHESRLGRLLDPVLDACFFSAAAWSLARWHLLPWWLAGLVSFRYFAPIVGGLALLFVRGRTLPVRHTPWGQRSTLATGVALLVTWLASFVAVPTLLLLALYAVVLVCMALALLGIVRRAPLVA